MSSHLDETLLSISRDFNNKIFYPSRNYIEVDIGEKAEALGFSDVGRQFKKVLAVVPIKEAEKGMKVRIDGRTFVNYGQLDSGVAIPGYVAQKSNLRYTEFIPNHSMILNFV